jgi:glycosyltransferase involved in cell wall biosynthesis
MLVAALGGSTVPPLISIGLPVYNGERTIGKAIESILSQSFSDFELIVSDNCSTDRTEDVCRSYVDRDSRVRYIRQASNIGAARNFKLVLDAARGRYYMWAACDDRRSLDFLMENVLFLEANPDYVASTCPNCFDGEEDEPASFVRFSISGDLPSRYAQFLRNCWQSHGIFYSLMRTDVIKRCDVPGTSFTAADWAIDLFLASHGGINRTSRGLAIFGRSGMSNSSGAWRTFRTAPVEFILPLYRFSRYSLRLMKPLSSRDWLIVVWMLGSLNLKASFDQTHAALYQYYRRNFKSAASEGLDG